MKAVFGLGLQNISFVSYSPKAHIQQQRNILKQPSLVNDFEKLLVYYKSPGRLITCTNTDFNVY